MNAKTKRNLIVAVVGAIALAGPLIAPNYQTQLAMLWVMILFAMTWDTIGGQMGYNSFGNIVFFGIGMYTTAVIQRNLYFNIEEYANVASVVDTLSASQYLTGLFVGMGASAVLCVAVSAILGAGILGMRGHYFAICTLGLGIAAGEIASGWEYIGAGSGMVTPVFPDELGERGVFYYYLFLFLAVITFLTLRWLYSGRFGLSINAIRDDEEKAEAMGIHTTRYKTVAWCVSAFFLGMAGGGVGNLIGFNWTQIGGTK